MHFYIQDRDLYTPLHAAAASDNVECVHILIEAGADIEAKNVYGNTPLHIACLNGCPPVIKELIANRINLGGSLSGFSTMIRNIRINVVFVDHNRGRELSRTDSVARRCRQPTWCSLFQDADIQRIES